MALVEFTIERQGMPTIALDTDGGGPYGLQSRTSGLGVGPIVPRFREGSGDGAEYDGERVEAKPVDLGIIVLGDDRLTTGDLVRRLAKTIRSRKNQPGPVLVATYATGEVFELPFRYVSGLEVDHQDVLPTSFEATLSIMCPLPYWVDRKPQQVAVQVKGDSRPFLPNLSHLQVGSSAAIDNLIIDNIGDVDAPVITRITGPGGPSAFSIDGEGYIFEAILAEGEFVTINTATKEVTDQTGTNRYDDLNDAPRFPYLPVGRTTVHIDMAGASAGRIEPTTTVLYTNRSTEPNLRGTRTAWSSGAAGITTESHPTTGFDGGDDGYLQLAWTADGAPDAQISHRVTAAGGETLSASMDVLSSRAHRVNPVLTAYDNDGFVVLSVYGESVELPANTVVTIGVDGELIGPLPTATAYATLTASIDETTGIQWKAGDTLRATRALVMDGPEAAPYFDGATQYCAWLGPVNASASVQYQLTRVGYSEISMFYNPRREVVL